MQTKSNFGVGLKAKFILAKYYGRRGFKVGVAGLPNLLFAVSLALFAIVLIPALRKQISKSALISRQTERIELQGTITLEKDSPQSARSSLPMGGVLVEVGPFSASSSSDGKYLLAMDAFRGADLPVIFTLNKETKIARVHIPETGKTVVCDIAFSQ